MTDIRTYFRSTSGTEVHDGKLTLFSHSTREAGIWTIRERIIVLPSRWTASMSSSISRERLHDGVRSVIGRGKIQILSDDEKMHALRQLMNHYHEDKNAYFSPAAVGVARGGGI